VQPTQADGELEEEHLVNFVVNSLGGVLPLTDLDSSREWQHCRGGSDPPPTAIVHPKDCAHQRFEDAPRPVRSDSPPSDEITQLSM
jgi:hypothetical protein